MSIRRYAVALCLPLLAGIAFANRAQEPLDDRQRPTQGRPPTAAEKAKEPKEFGHSDGTVTNHEIYTFDYLRINRPSTLVALGQDVRAKRLPQSVLDRAVSPSVRDALLKFNLTQDGPAGVTARQATIMPTNGKAFKFDNMLDAIKLLSPSKKVTAPTLDFGTFPLSKGPTLMFIGVAEKDGYISLPSSGTGIFRFVRIVTYTGKLIPNPDSPSQLVPERDKLFNAMTQPPPFRLPVKAGQAYAIPVYTTGGTEGQTYNSKMVVNDPTTVYTVPLHAQIKAPDKSGTFAYISVGDGVWIADGKQAQVTVTLANFNSKPATISFPKQDLAPGVTAAPATITVPPYKIANQNLTLSAAPDAPERRGYPVALTCSNTVGNVNAAKLMINVCLPLYAWYTKISQGKVSSQNDILLGPDGTWIWEAHLHDSSIFYGDSYALSFNFNKGPKPGQVYGYALNGDLGAKFSGPAVNAHKSVSGKNAWLAANYGPVADAGIQMDIEVKGNPFDLIPYLKAFFEKHGKELLALLPFL